MAVRIRVTVNDSSCLPGGFASAREAVDWTAVFQQ